MSSAMAQTLSQPVQCSIDSQGNRVCIGTQTSQSVCGIRSFSFPGMGTTYTNLACDNVVIQSTTADGRLIYKRVLGGSNEDLPRRFFFDGQDDVVLLGTTWSSDFPTTPNAVQPAYAGPAAVTQYGTLRGGGDLFLSVLNPAGDLLYSTFLGSSGRDDILDMQPAPPMRVDILVSAAGSNFPVAPADVEQPSSCLVLLRIDLNRPATVRAAYLPIGPPGLYTASFGSDSSVAVATSGGLYTFSRHGRLRTFVSLDSFAFDEPPGVSPDPAGDVWLLGTTKHKPIVTKLAGGTVEVFRWTLPTDVYLFPPFFGPDGLTYFAGIAYIYKGEPLLSTSPNALLTAPCSTYISSIVGVLSSQGEVRLLSYLPSGAKSFAANSDGSVSVILGDGSGTRVPVDLNPSPSAACVLDGLARPFYQPFGVGQTVRLHGGGFGPVSAVAVTPGANQTFPASLGGLQVRVNGIAAPILSAARGEVVFAIPFGTPEGDAVPVIVEDQGQRSAPLPIMVRTVSPQIVSTLNEDGRPNTYLAPASRGSTVTLLFTGLGPYTPPLSDGQIAPSDEQRRIAEPVSISFQTSAPNREPGKILYAGPAPGSAGQAAIKVQLPLSWPSYFSEDMVTLTVGSVSVFVPGIIVQ